MKKKGNISLLVLFVLLACSLLGVIAVQYTKQMAIQTNQVYDYYRAYYLAKGGIEMGLTLLQQHKIGYSLEFTGNNFLTTQNLQTGNRLELSINGISSNLSQGTPKDTSCVHPFIIPSGESFLLPLFTDTKKIKLADSFSGTIDYENKSYLLENLTITGNTIPRKIGVGILVASGGALSETGIFFTTKTFEGKDFFQKLANDIQNRFSLLEDRDVMDWKYHPGFQNYLMIANKDTQELTFCLETINGEPLATQNTYITSFGYAGTKKIGLEAIYKEPTPSYLIDSNIEDTIQ